MSLSQAIAPHLPYLRRFARALSGTQSGGDAYAVATLEAIMADPAEIDDAQDLRVALFRILLRVWNSVPLNEAANPVSPMDIEPAMGAEANVQRRLEALPPRPRLAFLLQAVEGFSVQRIAETLDCSQDEVAELLGQASKDISDQLATDILIIEDEPIIAMDLEALVESLGHRVTNIARTHREAVGAIATQKPGLVLADIQLADGSSGIDAVNDILSEIEIPVIFITAYPERLLTGLRPEPTFLVTKPFNADAVKAIISQALFFDRRSHRADAAAAS
ncbi:MAG: response regulator [Chelatococcus sp.]|uniref:response regulator n=1 Tax=unclassified Chelatococcus TaxID=2638111 RepID=UPI001BCDDFBE|nr:MULTISPECIES: response regulator [unclassified Chelatococcus]CAH1663486.1 Phyllosphere-induced regulator PhyR [Hyphomicrobiales bacterium]MBS7741581.1 response regulator [Chelatococcus sp. HY11]MBX3536330.1 response regulator [Chelatococcus sp.]MBX3544400.1 response regulator [Chelatococcus sp.]MCO5079077.1 response regulator [Chelatococcus sp.]